jgi:hypothetical protein
MRNYIEDYYQYWYFRRKGAPSPEQTRLSTDPLRMISQRITQGIRADRKTVLISIDRIIDDALKTPAQVVTDVTPTPEIPSFSGLELANPAEMRKLTYAVETEPTTTANYTHRLSVLHAYTATIAPADRDAVWGYLLAFVLVKDSTGYRSAKYKSPTPDNLVAIIEELRRTEGNEIAYRTLDGALKRSLVTIH